MKFLLLCFFSVLVFANNLKHISVQLNWKNQFEFAGFYVAKELGKDLMLLLKSIEMVSIS